MILTIARFYFQIMRHVSASRPALRHLNTEHAPVAIQAAQSGGVCFGGSWMILVLCCYLIYKYKTTLRLESQLFDCFLNHYHHDQLHLIIYCK